MKRERTISIAAVVAAALVISSCGSSGDESSSDGGLRAPTPIEMSSTGADSSRVANLAADEPAAQGGLAADDMMIAPWFDIEYVLGDGLVAPTDDTGYVFDAATELTVERVSELAEALEVPGEPVRIDDGYGVSWRVGPEDGTEPSLWVYDDAMQVWNYSSAWATQEEGRGDCAVSVDADGNETVDCPEPVPPTGVPTAEDAEAKAVEILGRLGVDAASVEFDTYADEWFASVSANSTIDARTVFSSWGFGFGENGVLQYASGSLATPEVVGPYPLVDVATAFERLVEQSYAGIGGGPLIADTAVSGAAVAEIGVDAPTADIAVAPPVSVAPVDGSIPEPETITVTLVDVVADLWWVWDVDGSTWLLPAYRFIGDDGGWYIVPAVTDEYLIRTEPTSGTAGPTPEPGVPEPGDTEPGASGVDGKVDPVEPSIDDAAAIEEEVRAMWDNDLPMPLQDLIDEAAAAGFEVRTVIEDGEPLATTMDYNTRRINVEVVSGDVVAIVSIG
jgi:hypothetical protein